MLLVIALYALGFGVFLVPVLEQVIRACGGSPPGWLGGRFAVLLYALAAVAFYSWSLMRSAGGGGQWPTVGKVVVFLVVIGGGFWVLISHPPGAGELAARIRQKIEADPKKPALLKTVRGVGYQLVRGET